MTKGTATRRSVATRRMRRASTTVVAAALAAGLVGCVTIPGDGSVITGREVVEQDEQTRVVVTPEGPAVGADQEELLRGFIAAFSGSDNYDVARQFLTDSFAQEWDPRESVLIRTGGEHIDRVSAKGLEYDILNSAIVDRDGIYSSYSTTSQTLGYEFTQEDGEWRISTAPNGIVLSSGTFGNLFAEHAVYFLDPTRRSLVPDLRWFPAGTATARIVGALLKGPPPWLQGAVGTAFPEGTQLISPRRVSVDTGVAMIDLSPEVLSAGEQQRQLMRAQLEASLGNTPSVTSIQVTVDGTPLTIPTLGENAPQLRPKIDSRTLVLKDDEFGYLANNKISTIERLSDKVVATQPTAVTLGVGGTTAVTLGDGGVYLVRLAVQQPTLLDSRAGLIDPDLDIRGYVWSAQRSSPTSLRVFDTTGNEFTVETTLPADSQIVSLSVSRDGARVAMLLSTNVGPRLVVAAVIRDQNREQVPLSIGEARTDVAVGTGKAIDVTWLDDVTVATLSTTGAEDYAVTAYQVGGKSRDLGDPGPATTIVGGASESALRVLGADGSIEIRRTSRWQASTKVSLIAAQR